MAEFGLIGKKLTHSYSAEIHRLLGDYAYELIELEEDEVEPFLNSRNFKGLNVTIPYKEKVIPFLDYVDESAKRIGAVNTIKNKEGKLYGYNTDCLGLKDLALRTGVSFKGKKVLILGSGGTSKTASYVSEELGAKTVMTASRTQRDGRSFITYEKLYGSGERFDIIINTTPCGMYPDTFSLPLDTDSIPSPECFIDVIYNPLRSPLCVTLEKKGVICEGGLYMLVSQAFHASMIFQQSNIDYSLLEKIYSEVICSRENIVLCGMPSCGKSSIGKRICRKTGKKLYDTDAIITEKTGRTPAEIIENEGESAFRKIEGDVIRELSAAADGKVISLGGGALTVPLNSCLLKKNGRIYFIDRPLDKLTATPDRPLSSTREALGKLFSERYDTFVRESDHIVRTDYITEKNVDEIIDDFNSYRA